MAPCSRQSGRHAPRPAPTGASCPAPRSPPSLEADLSSMPCARLTSSSSAPRSPASCPPCRGSQAPAARAAPRFRRCWPVSRCPRPSPRALESAIVRQRPHRGARLAAARPPQRSRPPSRLPSHRQRPTGPGAPGTWRGLRCCPVPGARVLVALPPASRTALRAAATLFTVPMAGTLEPAPANALSLLPTSLINIARPSSPAQAVSPHRAHSPTTHPNSNQDTFLSRPVEDCDGCAALAGVRNLGLDDPSAGRPD
jgi:hypothetical protein